LGRGSGRKRVHLSSGWLGGSGSVARRNGGKKGRGYNWQEKSNERGMGEAAGGGLLEFNRVSRQERDIAHASEILAEKENRSKKVFTYQRKKRKSLYKRGKRGKGKTK